MSALCSACALAPSDLLPVICFSCYAPLQVSSVAALLLKLCSTCALVCDPLQLPCSDLLPLSIKKCIPLFNAALLLKHCSVCRSCSARWSLSPVLQLLRVMQHTCSCVIFFSCLALFLKLCSMCALCVSVAAPCDVQRACSAALCSIDFFINTLSIPSQYSLKRFSCLAPDLLPVIRSNRI